MSGLLYLAELSRHCPLELRRHELGKRDSDAHLKASKTCGMPVTLFPTKSRVQVPNPPTCCGWSLWTASNRLPSPYEGDALPDELQRRELPTLASNQEPPEPESGALPF